MTNQVVDQSESLEDGIALQGLAVDWREPTVVRSRLEGTGERAVGREVAVAFARIVKHGNPNVRGVYLSGSALREDFNPTASDVDLIVWSAEPDPALKERLRTVAVQLEAEGAPPLDVQLISGPVTEVLDRHRLGLADNLVGPAFPAEQLDRTLLAAMRVHALRTVELARESASPSARRMGAKGLLRFLFLEIVGQSTCGLGPAALLGGIVSVAPEHPRVGLARDAAAVWLGV